MDQYFVTLDPSLVMRHPYKLLGRLLIDVYSPDRDYEPQNPSEALSGLWENLSADQEHLTLEGGQPHPIRAVFANFLKSHGKHYSKNNLKALMLKDHHEGFQAILQRKENREKMSSLLDRNGNKAFMIVGILITTSNGTSQGHSNDTIHAIAYRVVRKTETSGHANAMSWIEFGAENRVKAGGKRFDWRNVAMGEHSESETPIEIQYDEDDDVEAETDERKERKVTTQEEHLVLYLTGELPGV